MSLFGSLCDTTSLIRQAADHIRRVSARSQAQSVTPSSAGMGGLYQTGTDGNYPSTAGAVYVLIPVECDAQDSEGASATYAQDADQKSYGVNLGTSVPPQGTTVVATFCGGRLAFRFDG